MVSTRSKESVNRGPGEGVVEGGVVVECTVDEEGEEGDEDGEEDEERGVDEAPGVVVGEDGVVTVPPPPVDGTVDMMTDKRRGKWKRIWG